MISEVVNLEYIVVPNENDALVLENSLIKQLKPKFNILLRDDKTYPYIYIDTNDDKIFLLRSIYFTTSINSCFPAREIKTYSMLVFVLLMQFGIGSRFFYFFIPRFL
jgi:hypothetical protein